MRDLIPAPTPPGGEFLFYQSDDGRIRLQVRLEDESVWLTQKLMAELFQKDVRTVNEHIQNIFEELLARIRDIRSSEKEFWRKVLEIYATSIDHDPSVEASRQFFATVQNKMHWAGGTFSSTPGRFSTNRRRIKRNSSLRNSTARNSPCRHRWSRTSTQQ